MRRSPRLRVRLPVPHPQPDQHQEPPEVEPDAEAQEAALPETATVIPPETGAVTSPDTTVVLCFRSEILSKDADIKFFTGLNNLIEFQNLFDHLSYKASRMQYWKGKIQTSREIPKRYAESSHYQKPGPTRKLALELELLIVLMRLRVGCPVHELSFLFSVSIGLISSIFTTWIKLMRKELGFLVMWPDRSTVREHLPECFRRIYPKVRVIIDCAEISIETPSALDVQAQSWSEYKHVNTIKFLVAITPNGLISYISPCYGGRATDQFIVRDSGFLRFLEPHDQILADRGFKIQNDLIQYQATIAIPPSTRNNNALTPQSVKKTCTIANVRIYVEQAIRTIKVYQILGGRKMTITLLPLCDDILIVCSALCNLNPPLCD